MFKVGDRVRSKYGVMTGVVTGFEKRTKRIVVMTDATEKGSRVRYAYREHELELITPMKKIKLEVEVPEDVATEEVVNAWKETMKAKWDAFDEHKRRHDKTMFEFEYGAVYVLNGEIPVRAEMVKLQSLVRLRNIDDEITHVPKKQTLGFYYRCFGIHSIEKV